MRILSASSSGEQPRFLTRRCQLFVRAGVPNEINVLGGPVVATTWKLGPDADATWAPWDPLYAGSFGPPGSPTTGIVALDVTALSDLRLQVL